MYDIQSRESGLVALALFALLIIGVVTGAYLFIKGAQDDKPVSTAAAEVVEAGSSAILRSAQNAQREGDAGLLVKIVAEYRAKNQGAMPAGLSSEALKGMGYYEKAAVAQGEQPPVATDNLRLVTGARCLASGATVEGASSQYAAQFSLETSDGSFEPQCKDG